MFVDARVAQLVHVGDRAERRVQRRVCLLARDLAAQLGAVPAHRDTCRSNGLPGSLVATRPISAAPAGAARATRVQAARAPQAKPPHVSSGCAKSARNTRETTARDANSGPRTGQVGEPPPGTCGWAMRNGAKSPVRSRYSSASVGSRRPSSFIFDLQRLAADLEQLRGAGDVAAGLLERPGDELALELRLRVRTISFIEAPLGAAIAPSGPIAGDGHRRLRRLARGASRAGRSPG